MAHLFREEARRSHGDKLSKLAGQRGEYPPDRASRIANEGTFGPGKGDANKVIGENFAPAAARQVSNAGEVISGDSKKIGGAS